jgi:hypothetical protein
MGTRGAPGTALRDEADAKKTICQDLCFLSCSARRFSSGNTRHPRSCPTPGGGCWSPGDMCWPQSCPEPGGGNRSHGDTRCPRSCPARPWCCSMPGGGNRSRGDTRRPQSCPVPGHVVLPELPCIGRRVLLPELPLAGLLLTVSDDFFLVASYCPTKNSRVLKKCRYSSAFSPSPLLLRSHRHHGFFFDFFSPCPSVAMSGALQRHQLS